MDGKTNLHSPELRLSFVPSNIWGQARLAPGRQVVFSDLEPLWKAELVTFRLPMTETVQLQSAGKRLTDGQEFIRGHQNGVLMAETVRLQRQRPRRC